MARRRNSISKRFLKMKGLPRDEQKLLERVANLIDAALNNRQPGNPYEPSRNKNDRLVYPVTGLTQVTGIKKTKLLWTASNSDQLLRYEIKLTNLETGASETRTSFTNNYTFYGDAGTYKALVKSVGRDGSSSPIEEIVFEIAGDVMMIEGAKNTPVETGIIVQDDILFMQGNKIFIWGSLVIGAYQGIIANSPVVFKLWRRKGDNATFDLSDTYIPTELIEQVVLYPATESASNLDDYALGQEMKRPVALRLSSFETSLSTMFSPIVVEDDEVGEVFTFFLTASGREESKDEVGLSLVIWEGSEGQADTIPGDPQAATPDYAWPHYNSYHCQNVAHTGGTYTDVRWGMAKLQEQYNLIGNQWTVALWFRPDDLRKLNYLGSEDTTLANKSWTLFRRSPMRSDNNKAYNGIRISLSCAQITNANEYAYCGGGVGDWKHVLNIEVSRSAADILEEPAGATSINMLWSAMIRSATTGTSDMLPWVRKSATAPDGADNTNNGWYFLMVCFEGATVAGAGLPKLRAWINNSRYGDSTEPPDHGAFHTNGMHNLTALILGTDGVGKCLNMGPFVELQRRCIQDDRDIQLCSFGANTTLSYDYTNWYGDRGFDNSGTDSMAIGSNMQIHQAGMWNVALDNWDGYGYCEPGTGSAAAIYLYNAGFGTDIDWKENASVQVQPDGTEFQPYIQAENLCHFWQFGNVEQAFSTGHPLRDLGTNLYNGDLNFTGLIAPIAGNSRGTPNGWAWNTGPHDVYSPEGTNGTTQSDYSYPGQNL